MAEPQPEPTCPPHHWLITQATATPGVEVWICRRCAHRKEHSLIEIERSHSWQGSRGTRKRAQ